MQRDISLSMKSGRTQKGMEVKVRGIDMELSSDEINVVVKEVNYIFEKYDVVDIQKIAILEFMKWSAFENCKCKGSKSQRSKK